MTAPLFLQSPQFLPKRIAVDWGGIAVDLGTDRTLWPISCECSASVRPQALVELAEQALQRQVRSGDEAGAAVAYVEELSASYDLCVRVFADKGEGVQRGLVLGERQSGHDDRQPAREFAPNQDELAMRPRFGITEVRPHLSQSHPRCAALEAGEDVKQGQGRLATLRTYVQLMDDGLGGGCGDGAGGLGLKQGWMFHPAGVMLVARRGERMGLEK